MAEVSAMSSSLAGITITTNEITGSARVEIDLGPDSPTLAYRVTRQVGTDGVSDLERAIEIATGLAENVREWAGESFDC